MGKSTAEWLVTDSGTEWAVSSVGKTRTGEKNRWEKIHRGRKKRDVNRRRKFKVQSCAA